MDNFSVEIAGHWLEYLDESHTYVVDGIQVPSITELVRERFGGIYDRVPSWVLHAAADKGTAVHAAIETYIKTGEESDLPELRGFISIVELNDFRHMIAEIPVILFDGDPVAAGRVDLVFEQNGLLCGADIKRTYHLNREYLEYQLNLYRTAYRQSYGREWSKLYAIHLRENKRNLVEIKIDEGKTKEIIESRREQC